MLPVSQGKRSARGAVVTSGWAFGPAIPRGAPGNTTTTRQVDFFKTLALPSQRNFTYFITSLNQRRIKLLSSMAEYMVINLVKCKFSSINHFTHKKKQQVSSPNTLVNFRSKNLIKFNQRIGCCRWWLHLPEVYWILLDTRDCSCGTVRDIPKRTDQDNETKWSINSLTVSQFRGDTETYFSIVTLTIIEKSSLHIFSLYFKKTYPQRRKHETFDKITSQLFYPNRGSKRLFPTFFCTREISFSFPSLIKLQSSSLRNFLNVPENNLPPVSQAHIFQIEFTIF